MSAFESTPRGHILRRQAGVSSWSHHDRKLESVKLAANLGGDADWIPGWGRDLRLY